jgi:hypothetical protein
VFDLITVSCRIVTVTDEALDQLNTLLADYAKFNEQQMDVKNYASRLALIQRLLAAIQRLTLPTSTYAHAASLQANSNVHSATRLTELVATASALRDDIAAGWLTSVVELAHADTYAGFLEMAKGLLGQGYKDAAAVIAGTSLEVHLKALATKHGLGLQAPNGGPKKMDAVNAELKAAGVYNPIEHKQVTMWLGIRNSAAHGNYGDYDEIAVRGLIEGVSNFAVKYPA